MVQRRPANETRAQARADVRLATGTGREVGMLNTAALCRYCCKRILQAGVRNIDSPQSAAAQLRFAAAVILILILRRTLPPLTFATQSATSGLKNV